MKKIILLSILLLAVLLNLFSCSKEAEYVPEYGTFYVSDGILQNTHVTLVIENETLTAPVTELSYALYDKCDFLVTYTREDMNRHNHYCLNLLEVYKDGAWQTAPICGASSLLANFGTTNMADPAEHQVQRQRMEFSHVDGEPGSFEWEDQLMRYCPLEPGVYRVRVQYDVYTDDENVKKPEGVPEAVAYFTVVAPTE